jgi:hypothetical protein
VIILHDEESFARFQRTLCPDLPDNQALDEIARLEFLRTGKMVCTLSGHPKPANDGHLKTGQR